MSRWPLTPAYMHGKYMDVLAANAVVFSPFSMNVPGHFTETVNGKLAPEPTSD